MLVSEREVSMELTTIGHARMQGGVGAWQGGKRCPGWLERIFRRIEAQWLPLSAAGEFLCFVVEDCVEVADCFSADPRQAGPAAP